MVISNFRNWLSLYLSAYCCNSDEFVCVPSHFREICHIKHSYYPTKFNRVLPKLVGKVSFFSGLVNRFMGVILFCSEMFECLHRYTSIILQNFSISKKMCCITLSFPQTPFYSSTLLEYSEFPGSLMDLLFLLIL